MDANKTIDGGAHASYNGVSDEPPSAPSNDSPTLGDISSESDINGCGDSCGDAKAADEDRAQNEADRKQNHETEHAAVPQKAFSIDDTTSISSPPSISSSLMVSPSPPSKLKVTMTFMQAYRIMRGPRNIEPSPLFSCLQKKTQGMGDDNKDDDWFRLACLEESKLIDEAQAELQEDNYQHTADNNRQSIFFLEPPEVSGVPCDSDDSDLDDGDYCFDDDRLDDGWIKANFVFRPDRSLSESAATDDCS